MSRKKCPVTVTIRELDPGRRSRDGKRERARKKAESPEGDRTDSLVFFPIFNSINLS